jgi:hypothetical protein
LARSYAAEALEQLLVGAGDYFSRLVAIEIPFVPAEGPTARLIDAYATSLGVELVGLDRRDRPVLTSARAGQGDLALEQQATRERKFKRQARKLSKVGEVDYFVWRNPTEVRSGIEQFLALEASGWKGRSGTALLLEPRAVTFTRTMARKMAQEGKVQIDALTLDGAVIAMTVTLLGGDRAFLWKTAYDERFGAYSPGAQLIVRQSQRQISDPVVRLTDSCTSADNEMIHRLWEERLPMIDLYLSCTSSRPAAFRNLIAREQLRRKVKNGAKAALRATREKAHG